MSSPKHDLQVKENHPKLVPQLFPNLPCCNPSFTDIVGAVAERHIPFFSWKNHLKIAYFEGMSLQDWTLENPYKNPFQADSLRVALRDKGARSEPMSWRARGITPENLQWVEVEESFQWRSFKSVLETLRSRKNRVFVLLGPFNPYLLTDESLQRYNRVKGEMEQWLAQAQVSYHADSPLPSEHYADASHPLQEGYREVAEELLRARSFRNWMKTLGGGN